ncbi:phenylalanyl-tRNA synthetase alpha subunit [Sagittula marina]|uniref:Phenylalanyl-tRNA synthetase alpha subunit n=1 Tax=Sagittula marina TaxID=943940 RepID=A0A7W6GT34_9RHOB|nr:hypothetical protein [Sagittula marina]MBB3986178.1 phenylalanyl-tRNA synthetase alpha subunit [Sagittula marina]
MAEGDDLLVEIGLSERKYAQALARLEQSSNKAAKGIENKFTRQNRSFVRGAEKANQSANAFANGGLKNIGMQLSQVAQQGAVTGNYLQAMSIQAADIGLAFGTAGIAIGALISVLGPIAINMAGFGDAAKEAEENVKMLADAMSRLEAARAGSGRGQSDLIGEYGALAERAQRLFEIEQRIAEIRAGDAFKAATRSVAQGLGAGQVFDLDPSQIRDAETAFAALRAEMDSLSNASQMTDAQMRSAIERLRGIQGEIGALRSVTDNFDDLADMLGVTEEQAQEIAARFAEIGRLDAGQKQADAMIDLAGYISEASGNLTEAEEEGQDLYDRLLQAAVAALDLAAVDMTAPIASASNAADGLVSKLSAAVALFNRLSLQDSKVYSGRGGDPRQFMEGGSGSAENYSANVDYTPIDEIIADAREKAARASGGKKSGRKKGAKSNAEKERTAALREVERHVERTRTAVEAYHHELDELEKLKPFFEQTGNAEAYSRAVQDVHEEFDRVQFEKIYEGIDSVSDAMANAIVNGEDMGEALKGVFRQIAADLLASGIQKMLTNLFTAGVGGGGGGIGKLFAGFFDGGGNIPTGQFGIAGENGPEIIRGPASVTSTKATAAMMQGSGSTSVVVNNYSGANVQTRTTTMPGGGRREEIIIGQQMASAMTAPGNPARRALNSMGARMPGEVT